MNELEIMWNIMLPLIVIGLCLGILFSFVAGSIKLGWKFAPYIIVFGFIVWWFNL